MGLNTHNSLTRFTLSLPNTGMAQEEVLVLSDLTFDSLEIGRAAKVSYNRTLIEKNPAWEGFTQYDEGLQHTWEEAGDIFLGKKFIQVGEGVAPGVLLITYGIEYNWEPPEDGDLISRVEEMRDKMWLHYSDWMQGKMVRPSICHSVRTGASPIAIHDWHDDERRLGLPEWL